MGQICSNHCSPVREIFVKLFGWENLFCTKLTFSIHGGRWSLIYDLFVIYWAGLKRGETWLEQQEVTEIELLYFHGVLIEECQSLQIFNYIVIGCETKRGLWDLFYGTTECTESFIQKMKNFEFDLGWFFLHFLLSKLKIVDNTYYSVSLLYFMFRLAHWCNEKKILLRLNLVQAINKSHVYYWFIIRNWVIPTNIFAFDVFNDYIAHMVVFMEQGLWSNRVFIQNIAKFHKS